MNHLSFHNTQNMTGAVHERLRERRESVWRHDLDTLTYLRARGCLRQPTSADQCRWAFSAFVPLLTYWQWCRIKGQDFVFFQYWIYICMYTNWSVESAMQLISYAYFDNETDWLVGRILALEFSCGFLASQWNLRQLIISQISLWNDLIKIRPYKFNCTSFNILSYINIQLSNIIFPDHKDLLSSETNEGCSLFPKAAETTKLSDHNNETIPSAGVVDKIKWRSLIFTHSIQIFDAITRGQDNSTTTS